MIEAIAEFVEEQSRLSFAGHRLKVFVKTLEERARQVGEPELGHYFSRLKDQAGEQSALLDLLTVNETSFFRNPRQFAFLAEGIVPELEKRHFAERSQGGGPFLRKGKLRVLSAGCATGEEPYSVAMVLDSALSYPGAWEVEIVAGDVSERCLSSAVSGYFEESRLRGIPEQYADKYLEKRGSGAVVSEGIRRMVQFRRLNLAEVMRCGSLPGGGERGGEFDLVFCRNVMIYFSFEAQQRLVETLFRLLRPGGYLFTGDAEPLHLFRHQFSSVPEAGCLVYRKPEVTADARPDA